MKWTVPALLLLLAAALATLGPFTAGETVSIHFQTPALAMGAKPAETPDANGTSWTFPAQPRSEAISAKESEGSTATAGQALAPVSQDEAAPDRTGATEAPRGKADTQEPQQAEPVRAESDRSVTENATVDEQEGAESQREKPSVRPDTGQEPVLLAQNESEDASNQESKFPWRQSSEPAPAKVSDAKGFQQLRLFRTVAFQGNFNALPKWKRVLEKAPAQVRQLSTCTTGCPPGATSWQRIMKQARGLPPMEMLKAVNTFFNKWPYRLDQDAYGTSDWWATPQEFLKLSGDCEDFAITKYYALKELGFSVDDLRIVVLRDRIRGIAHAILVVFLQGDAYVLDNVSSVIFSHERYKHYLPYYSLNEKHRWSHIPLSNKP